MARLTERFAPMPVPPLPHIMSTDELVDLLEELACKYSPASGEDNLGIRTTLRHAASRLRVQAVEIDVIRAYADKRNYCPNCGADMRGETDEK